jgi:hypothetical protein
VKNSGGGIKSREIKGRQTKGTEKIDKGPIGGAGGSSFAAETAVGLFFSLTERDYDRK